MLFIVGLGDGKRLSSFTDSNVLPLWILKISVERVSLNIVMPIVTNVLNLLKAHVNVTFWMKSLLRQFWMMSFFQFWILS